MLGQFLLPATVCMAMLAAMATAQANPPAASELNLPYGPVTRLASPDGSRTLYGVPYQRGINDGPQLWIEDTRTHQRRLLFDIAGTLSAVWCRDGSAFSVNDRYA